jgi:hypothetical protein
VRLTPVKLTGGKLTGVFPTGVKLVPDWKVKESNVKDIDAAAAVSLYSRIAQTEWEAAAG